MNRDGAGQKPFHRAADSDESRPPSRSACAPVGSPWLLSTFTWYCRRYIRRHFHALRIARPGVPPGIDGWPLVVFANHAAWWDPVVALLLRAEFFPKRHLYCPIEATQLRRYRFLRRLGFFGVDAKCRAAASQFLKISGALLDDPSALLVLTPQGRFADARERPVVFQGGVGHIAARARRAMFLPVAIEYVFWEERLPEILVQFGEPITTDAAVGFGRRAKRWQGLFQDAMSDAQDHLASLARQRDPARFSTVIRGNAGQGGFYDVWQRLRAAAHGAGFRKEHGWK
jgi:1-acyl-sn-glycerol-3-phosphate acyltransferase